MKKYLKRIEDIEALRNTDTKIYRDNHRGYFKFVNGVPCLFCDTSDVFYNATIDFNEVNSELYIEVEEEIDESYIGKLGWFSDDVNDWCVDVLDGISKGKYFEYKSKRTGHWYAFFKPLTPKEVEKYTGYKVEE